MNSYDFLRTHNNCYELLIIPMNSNGFLIIHENPYEFLTIHNQSWRPNNLYECI